MIENFIKDYEYYKNVNLKKYNTYRLSTTCDYLIYPSSIEELIKLLKCLKEEKIKYLILGGGSNIILSRPHIPVVIKLSRLNKIEISSDTVVAEAGTSLIHLANVCMNNNLYGLAFSGGIPGEVGASISMNAGAYNEDISSVIKEVKVLTPSLEVKTMTKEELDFSYRNSYLKQNKDYICIEGTFKLKYMEKEKIKSIMNDRKERRVSSQPLDMPSAGSVFRNPNGLSAGKLIDDLGLKGYQVGGAKISEKHANFIVNSDNATYDDILSIIEYTKKKVHDKYNIDLILEQEIIR